MTTQWIKVPAHEVKTGHRITTNHGVAIVKEVVFNWSANKWTNGVEIEVRYKSGRERIIAVGWDTMITRKVSVE
jgi:hypothetical protein